MRKETLVSLGVLGILALALTLIISVSAQPTPFIISGHVFYENGTACNNPTVNITNTNTSEEWDAETNATYNYYKLILANGTHVNASEILQFNVTSPDGSQLNITEHTVTLDEVNEGGFEYNITLAPYIVINEFLSDPSTGNDWVELYNPANSAVSLTGWTLNDSTSEMESLSSNIPANGYLVVDVGNRLNKGGDTITLLKNGVVVDQVAYGTAAGKAPVPPTDKSTGRYPNGVDTNNDSADFRIFDISTRGASNTGMCVASDGTAFGCGDTVTKRCTLNGNMCCEGDGLIIGSGQIRIYGNGYGIEGNGTGTGIYSPGNTFLEIHDLAIKNFDKGIWLQRLEGTPAKIYDYKIDNCNINNNSVGIDVDDLDTRSCTIKESEVHRNSRGIYVHGENGTNIKITNNKIYDNAISGFYSEDVCIGCEVDSNHRVSENGEGITMNASQWTVKSNVVTNNSGSGIYAGGSDNIFSANTIGNNKGNGIYIADSLEDITLESNTVCFNTPNDIFAVSGLSASGDNNSCANCMNYNDSCAPPGKCCVYPCVGCLGEHTGTLYRCGGVVTESCTFNGDITCPGGDGLIVGASGTAEAEPLVIDGAGYTLDGVTPGTSMRTGIYNPDTYDYVTIKDLEIKHFHHGINLGGSSGSSGTVEHNVIDNCSVHDNGDPAGFPTHGIATYHARNCSITNCEVYNNSGFGTGSCEDGGRGILLYGPGGHNTVTHNRVYDNGMVGIYSKMQNKYNYVAYNDVYGNGKQLPAEGTFMPGGISLACIKTDFWVVEHNNISDNAGSGISVGGSNNVFRYNNVTNTSSATGGRGNGIYIGRCSGNHTLISNTVCDSEGEDIYVQNCCSDVTGDENTCDMTSNYNDNGTTGCTCLCSAITAAFSAEQTKGAAPLTVNFTDESKAQGEIVSWKWDFGDGNTSEEQNATHTYSTAEPYSYYNVSLNVTTSGGDSDTETKTEYIKVWKPGAAPDADFSASPRKMQVSPLTVDFTDESTGKVESWFWEFGDGATSNEQNPTHEYTTGIYTVSLKVTGPGGSSTDTKTDYIVVNRPDPVPAQTNAHFFADKRSGSPPLEVIFTDMSRSEGEIDPWQWDFGDGNTSTEQTPTHTYSSAGCYNVSLEVTAGDAKANETKTGYVTVSSEQPGICGDVNEDEAINMGDVARLLYYVSYPGEYAIGSEWAADVNCDESINMGDVARLLYNVSYPGEYELGCCDG